MAETRNYIVNKIVVRPANRQVTDIGVWRDALKSADKGRRQRLYNLYEDLLIDGVLSDAVEKRIEAITNAELVFQSDGEVIPEMEDLIDTPEFEDLLKEIMLAKFWGISVIEFDFTAPVRVSTNRKQRGVVNLNFTSIPRKHIRPEFKEVAREESDERGIPYADDPFVIEIGKPKDLGLFLKTAPYAIYKRGGFGDWAQWIELFGMPQRIGKYSAYDPESRKLLEEAFERAGSAPSMVVPKETDVETDNSGMGGNGGSFDEFRNACNEEMIISVLGQTMTTLDGSSRAQGEVHKEVEEGKNKSDRRFVQRVLNRMVLPILEARGFPVKNGSFYFPEAGETLSTMDRLEKDMRLNGIIDIPEEYFYETYDLPKPNEGDRIASKGITLPFQGDIENLDYLDSPPSQGGVPRSSGAGWFTKLTDFFVSAPAAMTGAIKSLIRLNDEDNIAENIDLDKLFNKALKNIYQTGRSDGSPRSVSPQTGTFNRDLFDLTNNPLQAALDKTFTAAGNDWSRKHQGFADQFKTNTAVFAAFKAHAEGRKIAELLTKPDGSIRPWSEFKKEALKIDAEWNKQWLQTEYNTAVRAARMAVNWRRFEETKHLYPNLEYLRSRSANPRDSHRKFWGTILPMDHEFWKWNTPPSDWECKCGIRATDAPATAPPEGWQDVPKVFRVNPGTDAEMVNTRETAYYKYAREAARQDIEQEARQLQAEKIKLEAESTVKKFKKGGELHTPVNLNQYSQEAQKNVRAYTKMAEKGGRYKLLQVVEADKQKNPDAWNFEKEWYSDAKVPTSTSGKNAIQNAIKDASKKSKGAIKVKEVVIEFEQDYPYAEVMDGFKAALQKGRAAELEVAYVISKNSKIKQYDIAELREVFWGKKQRR